MENPNVDKKKIHYLLEGGIIAAIYAVLTYALMPISYGLIQVRVSESLNIMPYFTPAAVPGLFIGCLIANLLGLAYSGLGWLDVILGSMATLIAAFIASRIRNKWLVPLPAVLVNAVVIGLELNIIFQTPLLLSMLYIFIGQAVACYAIGIPLLFLLERYKKQIFRLH